MAEDVVIADDIASEGSCSFGGIIVGGGVEVWRPG